MREFVYQKRWMSFCVVFLIYVIAFCVGLTVFLASAGFGFILRLFLADVAATILVWLFGIILKNSSVYDPYWSVAPPVLAVSAMVFFNNFSLPILLLIGVIFLWAIRLTANWIYTFKNLNWQDWRYIAYKANFPKLWHFINFFGINMMPTLFVFVGMLPVFEAIKTLNAISFLTVIGLFVSIMAVLIELLADIQMHRFKLDPKNTKKTNDKGLWGLSRHPNYFGEIAFWFGLFFMMISASLEKFYLVICPIAILTLFVFISIPLMEKRQLARRADYIDYKQRVSMLIPLPQKKKREVEDLPDNSFLNG